MHLSQGWTLQGWLCWSLIVTRRTLLAGGLLFAAAHLLLFLPLPAALQPHLVQAVAALILAGFLPGFLLVHALIGQGSAPAPWWEAAVLGAGAAYVVLVGGMLGLSYLPGGPTLFATLLLFDALTLGLALWVFWAGRQRGMLLVQERQRVSARNSLSGAPVSGAPALPLPEMDWRWLLAGTLALLIVGGGLRLGNLGYSDFQGDEARAALRAAATLQSYEDVLFLHKKGPTEILLPTALYVLTGHLTEATARLPFALASTAALFAAWLLGRRLFNPLAGWIAAMFFALDGYFIGFARIVQYQSVVLLMSLLVVLLLYRLVKRPQALAACLSLAALLLATGLLSHYEGALAALPAAVLWGVLLWQQRAEWKRVLAATAIAAAVGGALLGAFYAPYILNPRFAATYYYLTDRRIGGSPPLQQPARRLPAHNALQHYLRRAAADRPDRGGHAAHLLARAAPALGAGCRRGDAPAYSHHLRQPRLAGGRRARLDHRPLYAALCPAPADPTPDVGGAGALALVRGCDGAGALLDRKAAHACLHLLHPLAADRRAGRRAGL